jgi:hypothetical protein
MGIPIDPTPPKTKWGDAVKPIAKAIADLVQLKYLDALADLADAMKAGRATDETLGQRAWTLWRESVAFTLEEFFRTAKLERTPERAGKLKALVEDILEDSAKIVADEELTLSVHDLKIPHDFRLYWELRATIPAWAKDAAPKHLRDDDYLKSRLDRAFIQGFHRAWIDGAEHFAPLKEAFEATGGAATERFDAWLRYYAWLRAEVEDQPLFGQEEGGPSLADIFVPLRCFWRERPKARRAREEEGEGRMTARVRWLAETLDEWLKAGKRDDPLRVVTGGPGCGKSSSARMFARDVAFADRANVFLVPLQGLDVTEGVEEVVDVYVAAASHSSACLPESPIRWLRNDPKPLLLVFDGLDEAARPDGAGLEVTRQFLGNLRTWLAQVNAPARRRRESWPSLLAGRRRRRTRRGRSRFRIRRFCMSRRWPGWMTSGCPAVIGRSRSMIPTTSATATNGVTSGTATPASTRSSRPTSRRRYRRRGSPS